MTYFELANLILSEFSDEQKGMDVTVYDVEVDKFYPTRSYINLTYTDDVLDKNHPFLVIN